jgi:hypothetical protein
MKIAIDLGRYSTQAIANGQQVSFPSVLGEDKEFSPFSQNNNLTLKALGRDWLIGDTALEQSSFSVHDRSREWIQSDRFLVLTLAAINQLIKTNVDVEIITGLPHDDFKDFKTDMKKRLIGNHVVNDYQNINIHTVTVLTQAIAGIYDYASDNQERYLVDRIQNKLIGCINVGSHTVEVGTAQFDANLKPNYIINRCKSLKDGVWKAIDLLSQRLASELPQSSYDEYELDNILRTGKAQSFGEKDVSQITGQVTNEYFDYLMSECRKIWTDQEQRYSLDKLHTIVCVGGKGFEFGTYLLNRNFHPNVHLSRDGEWATVRGYQKFGMR